MERIFTFNTGGLSRTTTLKDALRRLHVLLIHPNPTTFEKTLASMDIVVDSKCVHIIYAECPECRANYNKHASSVAQSADYSWRRGAVAVLDITEPAVEGIGGCRYLLCIKDTQTGYCVIESLARRSEALPALAQFLSTNPHVTTVRSDNAGEFTSEAWLSTLTKYSVGAETCAPGGSESIGAAERLHQTVKNNLDKLLEIMGLHDARDLWPWLVKAVQLGMNYRHSATVGDIPARARN